MRKLTLIIILLLFLFSSAAGIFAQEAELPPPGLTPDSPFYFLDTLGEKIGMFFTFGTEKKAEKALKYADEKIAEVKVMAEKNKAKALKKANQKYQEFLILANQKTQEIKEKGKDIEKLAVLITEKTLKHQEVLMEVFERVPEEAKEAIQKAIEVSKKGFEEAIQAVSGEKKEELQKKFKEITTGIPIYPGVSEVEAPLEFKEEIQDDLSIDAEIMIYSSDDSPEKIKNWYKSQLTDKGWEKIMVEKYGIILWEKDKTGLGIFVVPEEEVSGIPEIEEEKTVFLLIKDKLEVWKKFLGILEEEKSEEVPKIPEEAPKIEKREEVAAIPNTPMMLDIDVSTIAGKPYTIGWREVSGATSYILERDIISSFSNPIAIYSGSSNSFTETPWPSVSYTYYLRVKACNDSGCSSWSKTTELWVEVLPSITVIFPNGGESINQESCKIQWDSKNIELMDILLLVYDENKNQLICYHNPIGTGFTPLSEVNIAIFKKAARAEDGYYLASFKQELEENCSFVIPPSYYKIKLRDSFNNKTADTSDGYFVISPAPNFKIISVNDEVQLIGGVNPLNWENHTFTIGNDIILTDNSTKFYLDGEETTFEELKQLYDEMGENKHCPFGSCPFNSLNGNIKAISSQGQITIMAKKMFFSGGQ